MTTTDTGATAQLTFSDLAREFRLTYDRGDPWGSTMLWWFAAAEEMFRRGLDIPDEWRFRPGAAAHREPDPDDYHAMVVADAEDAALARFGAALHILAGRLDRAGFSY